MSDYYLKITDKASIETSLELDNEYQFTGVICIEGCNKKSDQEGGFDFTFQAKFVSGLSLIKGDKVIKVKDKKRISQIFKGAVWHLQNAVEKMDEDEKEFYGYVVKTLIIPNLLEIYERYNKKI